MFNHSTIAPSVVKIAAQRRPQRKAISVTAAYVVVVLAYISNPVITDLVLPILPELVKIFATDAATVQTVMSATFVGSAVGCLFLGPLSDSYGRVKTMGVAYMGYSLASLGCLLATDIDTLIAMRFLQGMASTAAPVIGLAIINDMLGRTKAAAANSRAIATMAFTAVTLPFISYVANSFFGWKTIWILCLAYGVVLTVACFLFLPETHPKRERRPLRLNFLLTYGKLLINPKFMMYTLIAAFSGAVLLSYLGPHSYIIQETLGKPAYLFGVMFAPIPLGVFIGARVAVRLVSTIDLEATLVIGCFVQLLASLKMLWLGYNSEPVLLELLMPVITMAFGMGMVMPTAQIACVKVFPQFAGAGSSVSRASAMLVAAVGMQLALHNFNGWLKAPATVMTSFAAICLILALIALIQHRLKIADTTEIRPVTI